MYPQSFRSVKEITRFLFSIFIFPEKCPFGKSTTLLQPFPCGKRWMRRDATFDQLHPRNLRGFLDFAEKTRYFLDETGNLLGKGVKIGVNATLLNSSQFFPKNLEIPSWVRFVLCARRWACASPHFPSHSFCKMCECPRNKYAEHRGTILLFCHSEWHNFSGLAFLIWNSTVAMLSC